MLYAPITQAEADRYRYGARAGLPDGKPYRHELCAYEVSDRVQDWQCLRHRGHGPAGLYCKQHARIVERHQRAARPDGERP